MTGYLDPGDQVLIPDPNYSLYGDVALAIGAEATFVEQTPDFHLDIDKLKAAAGPRAKMVVLCNPCNPTGVVLHRAELEALAEWCVERDLLILADEAYDHLVYDGRQHVSALDLPGIEDRVLYCQTLSKTFAMTGWRIGYLAARDGMAENCMLAHKTSAGWVNWAVQRAGHRRAHDPVRRDRAHGRRVRRRRLLLDEILSGADGLSWRKPEGTFYAFVKYTADLSSKEMTAFLLERGLAARSGTEFGSVRRGVHPPQLRHRPREHSRGGKAAGRRCRRGPVALDQVFGLASGINQPGDPRPAFPPTRRVPHEVAPGAGGRGSSARARRRSTRRRSASPMSPARPGTSLRRTP